MNTTNLSGIAELLRARGTLAEVRNLTQEAGATPVTGCDCDSRVVRPGHVFVCKGQAFRPAYLVSALEKGAVAYLCDEEHADSLEQAAPGVPALVASDLRRAMAYASADAFGHPDHDIKVVGITGTKGKSTVSYMLRSVLDGEKPYSGTGVIGSIDTFDGVENSESHNTTPESPDLWRHLANAREAGLPYMDMEVSSQGLKYDRVLGLTLDVACFLNIGRDHISPIEHPTFEDYFESKLRIFDQAKTAVVNLGTEEVDRVLEAASTAERLVTVGVEHPEASLWASDVRVVGFNIEFNLHGLCADESEAGEKVLLGIAGDFNVENALVAIAAAHEIGIGIEAIKKGLSKLRVPGRMEVVESKDGRVICVVDYAHNQLSFRSLFSSVKRAFPTSPVIAVFGAAGGKAQERREAAPYSDLMIFANEDPAHEDPMKVCRELAEHVPDDTPNEIILDREAAVHAAFKAAREEYVNADAPTIVLLLAKGDEELMHVGDEFVPIESDLSLANRLIDVTQFD